MKKEISIKGMNCAHCQARVEKALNSLPGVTAKNPSATGGSRDSDCEGISIGGTD
jgi:copper chaperone CopZ